MQLEQAERQRFIYAHEISIGSLPGLANRLRVPKYFINDYHEVTLQPRITPRQLLRHIHFPVAFFGPPGSTSPLHTDGAILADAFETRSLAPY
jgi:hypothetical protein